MLRITIHESSNRTIFKLEGKLAGPWVQELEQCWVTARTAQAERPVVVDLTQTSFVDAEGKDLLARMAAAGAELIASGPLTKYVCDQARHKGVSHVAVIALLLAGAAGLKAQTAPPALKLTLRDAVQMALRQNPQVLIANLDLAQSQQEQDISRSALLPQASFQTFERAQRFNLEAFIGRKFPGTPQHAGPFEIFQSGPIFSAPVFDLTLWRRWKASKEVVKAAGAQEQTVREQFAALVVSQYLGALRAAADVKAAQSREDLARALYTQADDLQKSGVGTGIDTLRANVELQNETQNLIGAQTVLQTSMFGLSRLLSLPPAQPVELADAVSFFETAPIEVDRSLEAAYANRPEMQALRSRAQALGLEKQAAEAERMPSARFDGNWAYQGTAPNNVIPSYAYTISVNVPLFTAGRIKAETARAEIEQKKIARQQEEQRNAIALEVKTAIAQLEAARHQVEVANLGVKLAGQEVEQARDRFQAGVANNIEVVTAQDALARANNNQIVALDRYNQARADLAHATGQMQNVYAR